MTIPSLLPASALKTLVYAVNSLPIDPYILCAGVYAGGDIVTMAQARPDAEFAAFDSFQGLAEPTEIDNPNASAGKFACSQASFMDNIDGIPVGVWPGWITPESLREVTVSWPIDMIWIDLDHGEPTRAILDAFIPQATAKAVIMTHDYSNPNYPGIKTVCDTFGEWEDMGNSIARLKR